MQRQCGDAEKNLTAALDLLVSRRLLRHGNSTR